MQLHINEMHHEFCVLRNRVHKEQQRQEEELAVGCANVQDVELPRCDNNHDVQNAHERGDANNNNQIIVQNSNLSDENHNHHHHHHHLGTNNCANAPLMQSHPNFVVLRIRCKLQFLCFSHKLMSKK